MLLTAGFTPSASADVRVYLKNGNTVDAESCTDMKTKYVCSRSGGTFELQKSDVSSIKEVAAAARSVTATDTAPADQAKPGDKPNGQPAKTETKAPASKEGKVVSTQGLDPETEKRLDEIEKRKKQLLADRETMVKDRDKLTEDVNKAGTVQDQAQLDSFRTRLADLEKRIKGFNDEVSRINEEETRLLESIGKKEKTK